MNEISDKNWAAASDPALIAKIGAYIKHHRILQDKSQSQLAKEAGIVRSTLSLLERGENVSLMVFIQLLRALKLLNMLQVFQVTQQISPIQLAKLERKQKIRAGRSPLKSTKRKSSW